MSKRRIVVSSDEDEPEGRPVPRPLHGRREVGVPSNSSSKRPKLANASATKRRDEQPASSEEIRSVAEACKREVIEKFPEYASVLRRVAIEVSARMESSGAKTVFEASTLRPQCVRLSLPIFSLRENLHGSLSDVVKHELAHAIAGREAAHGDKWQTVCRRIGGTAALYHTLSCHGDAHDRRQVPAQRGRSTERARRPATSTSSSREASWKSATETLLSQLIRF